ncbi:MAG: hypothetical protein CME26_07890 [Gemmatimonadetes bacterium]|nr:hypothetical protein [Gemmatimonadota bacterium]|tara:strand:+ start:654 stop:1250 length:597 start_codon:yes stop_codon:yes gene_type:complete
MREWILVLVLCAACTAGHEEAAVSETVEVELPELKKLDFGEDFVLTDQNNAAFDSRSLRGRVVLLFFGFTTCPDACPTTLSRLSLALDMLGEDRDRVRIVWVTVDPERDTPARTKAYLEYWQMPVIGLTGTREEIDDVAGNYGVYHKRSEEETEAGYLVDHTTLVYLIDPEGSLRYLSQPHDEPAVLAGLIRKVLDGA